MGWDYTSITGKETDTYWFAAGNPWMHTAMGIWKSKETHVREKIKITQIIPIRIQERFKSLRKDCIFNPQAPGMVTVQNLTWQGFENQPTIKNHALDPGFIASGEIQMKTPLGHQYPILHCCQSANMTVVYVSNMTHLCCIWQSYMFLPNSFWCVTHRRSNCCTAI